MTNYIAHRINSLAALDKALACNVAGIECDVQLTCDNQAVLYHDYAVEGRAVSSLTCQQVIGLINPDDPKSRTITLAQFFEALMQRKLPADFCVMAELKGNHPELVVTVLKEYSRYDLAHIRLMFLSFFAEHIAHVHALKARGATLPKGLEIGLNIAKTDMQYTNSFNGEAHVASFDKIGDMIDTLEMLPDFLSLDGRLFPCNDAFTEPYKKVAAWTINDKTQIKHLADNNINYIITDI